MWCFLLVFWDDEHVGESPSSSLSPTSQSSSKVSRSWLEELGIDCNWHTSSPVIRLQPLAFTRLAITCACAHVLAKAFPARSWACVGSERMRWMASGQLKSCLNMPWQVNISSTLTNRDNSTLHMGCDGLMQVVTPTAHSVDLWDEVAVSTKMLEDSLCKAYFSTASRTFIPAFPCSVVLGRFWSNTSLHGNLMSEDRLDRVAFIPSLNCSTSCPSSRSAKPYILLRRCVKRKVCASSLEYWKTYPKLFKCRIITFRVLNKEIKVFGAKSSATQVTHPYSNCTFF